MIALSGITKRYGAVEAIRDISFTVDKGQTLGLLGQNGAGKTTTLNILTGYLAPTRGTVSIGGHDMFIEPHAAKRKIGYLPERPPLYDEMTVDSFLRFVCDLREVQTRSIPAHVKEIAGMTGLSDILPRRIGNLSKGYRQRVGLAQALCGDPDVLVLDEPTVGLDPRQTAEFRETLRILAGKHTILLSSHILSEVQELCNRVIILHRGAVLFDSEMSRLHGEEGDRLRVRIESEPAAILPALNTLRTVARVIALPGNEPGITDVILEIKKNKTVQRELFTLLSGLQKPILYMTPVTDTLEDIFLRVTAG